jgi:branched-chain amino acid transport system substrate-binding protein
MDRFIAAALMAAATCCAAPSLASAQSVTVYSSLPLSGAARVQTKAVNAGAQQALTEAGGTAGGVAVRLVTLNDATNKAGTWVPERVAANARRAVKDPTAVAFLGTFNSGAAAIAIPITNEAGLPMISPSTTATGLTTDGPDTDKGEPDKYYPTGVRTFFRLPPNDAVQAAALATVLRDDGCKKVVSVHDRDGYGKGMATLVRQNAARLGLRVSEKVTINPRTKDFGTITRSRPDCVVYNGITANGAPRMFNAVGRALPKAKLFAGDGVAESGFTERVSASVARRLRLTVATLAPEGYAAPGPAVIDAAGDPYAVYGYEAMKLVLDGLNAAGPTRAGLLGWLPTVQNRASVLGTYGFDPNGDTTLRTYGVYRVRSGELVWDRAVTAA